MTNKKEFYVGSTQLNTFINNRAKWYIEFVLGIRGESNVYSKRGQWVENGVTMMLEGLKSFEEVAEYCVEKYLEETANMEQIEEDVENLIKESISQSVLVFNEINATTEMNVPLKITSQIAVHKDIEGLNCRALLDFLLTDLEDKDKNIVIDLKSKKKLPTIVTRGVNKGRLSSYCRDNVRQQVYYHMVGDGKFGDMHLLYVCPSGSLLYKLQESDFEEYVPEITEALKEMHRLSSLTSSEIISSIKKPKESDFKWGFWTEEQIAECDYVWPKIEGLGTTWDNL